MTTAKRTTKPINTAPAMIEVPAPRPGMILVEMPRGLWPAIGQLMRQMPVSALGATAAVDVQRTLNDLDRAQTVPVAPPADDAG